jgi:hypothetical protein
VYAPARLLRRCSRRTPPPPPQAGAWARSLARTYGRRRGVCGKASGLSPAARGRTRAASSLMLQKGTAGLLHGFFSSPRRGHHVPKPARLAARLLRRRKHGPHAGLVLQASLLALSHRARPRQSHDGPCPLLDGAAACARLGRARHAAGIASDWCEASAVLGGFRLCAHAGQPLNRAWTMQEACLHHGR